MDRFDLKIEQALYGYSNGHHLLASSNSLSEKSQKVMVILSDLSGPEIQKGFTEYITGYPLEDDGYYALSKTWYAPEMKRPGCVWTHTLLFKFEDLRFLPTFTKLMELFIRPSQGFNQSAYSNTLTISLPLYIEGNSPELSNNNLKCLLLAIFDQDQPIIISSSSSGDYIEEIIYLWKNFNKIISTHFSFCTGSLANRIIEKRPLDLQIVPYDLLRTIARSSKDNVIFDMSSSSTKYPQWIDEIIPDILSYQGSKFKEFLETFDAKYLNKSFFKKFAQLYSQTKLTKRNISIRTFFDTVSEIFDINDCREIQIFTAELLLFKHSITWFEDQRLSTILLEFSTNENINYYLLSQEQMINLLETQWIENKFEVKITFQKLIENDLNSFGESLLKAFATVISPDQLPDLTDLDLGACNILVTMNYKFALCSELWKKPLNFQSEIIDCLKGQSIKNDSAANIIETIIENSSEYMGAQVYKIFGNSAISAFLSWCIKTNYAKNEKVKKWVKICKYNPAECVTWIPNINNFRFFISIISILDPYSSDVLQFGKEPWIKAFKQLNLKNTDDESKLLLAKFFMPIILLSNEEFPNYLVTQLSHPAG